MNKKAKRRWGSAGEFAVEGGVDALEWGRLFKRDPPGFDLSEYQNQNVALSSPLSKGMTIFADTTTALVITQEG